MEGQAGSKLIYFESETDNTFVLKYMTTLIFLKL